MSPMKSLIALFVVFAMATGVCAQEKRWSDQAELSFVDTGGNTEVTSLSAKNVLQYKFSEKVQAKWKLGAL
jgi:putative salt-induced outer membrane protein